MGGTWTWCKVILTQTKLLLLANSTSGILFEPHICHRREQRIGGSESEAFRSAQTQKEMVIISYAADKGAFSAQWSHSSSSDCKGLRSERSAETTLNCVTNRDVMDRTARVAPWLPVSLLRRRRASRVVLCWFVNKYEWKRNQTLLNEGGGGVSVLAMRSRMADF